MCQATDVVDVAEAVDRYPLPVGCDWLEFGALKRPQSIVVPLELRGEVACAAFAILRINDEMVGPRFPPFGTCRSRKEQERDEQVDTTHDETLPLRTHVASNALLVETRGNSSRRPVQRHG